MGAVDEGVAIEPAGWIEQLAQAFWTGRGIGDDACRHPALVARADIKPFARHRPDRLHRDLVDPGERRLFQRQCPDEVRRALALDLDDDAMGIVGDEAAEAVARGEAVDIGAKADALYRAAHVQAQPPSVPRRGLAAHRHSAAVIAAGVVAAIRLRIQAKNVAKPSPVRADTVSTSIFGLTRRA
ncbi:hypothetical protein ACVW0J_009644 [Bradyrhizobium sp. i1.7.7]